MAECLTCQAGPELWAKSNKPEGFTLEDSDHPNLAPFEGTLLLLDEPSAQPPHGSDGKQILVPTEAAKKRLGSLIGMGIDYDGQDLEGHDVKQKIGLITQAWIEGNKVKVKGNIWKKDFPEAMAAFRRNRGNLGMSMELANVYVDDKDNDIWKLNDFVFTGGAILKRDHAAYDDTELAASHHFVRAIAAASDAIEKLNSFERKDITGFVALGIEEGIKKALENIGTMAATR